MSRVEFAVDVAGSLKPTLTWSEGFVRPTKYLTSEVPLRGSA
jgi:hypothetical protein